MRSAKFVLVFVCFIVSLDPGAKIGLSKRFISQITDYVITLVNDKINDIKINDQQGSVSYFTFSLSKIQLHFEPVKKDQVLIDLIDETSIVDLRIHNLSGNGHLNAKYKISFLSDDITVDFHNISIISKINITIDDNGRPYVIVQAFTNMTSDQIDVHFQGTVSAIILEAISRFIKALFFDRIVDEINRNLPVWFEIPFNDIFKSFPLDLQLKDDLYVAYAMTKPPINRNNSAILYLSAYFYCKWDKRPPLYNPPQLPDNDIGNQKSFQIFLSDYVLQSAIDSGFRIGIYKETFRFDFTEKYHIISACSCYEPPKTKFNYSIFIFSKAGCNISAENKINKEVITFGFDLNLDLIINEYIKDDLIYLHVNNKTLNVYNVKWRNPQSFNISFFKEEFLLLLENILEASNSYIDAYGIPLPKFPEIGLSDLEQKTFDGYTEIFSDIIYH